jgi:uncharacterized protein YuzE
MKKLNSISSLIIAALVFASCNKSIQTPNSTNTYQDVIYGCKVGSGIQAAIDPLNEKIISFNTTLYNAVSCGPSCLGKDKNTYYISSLHSITEVNVSNGEVSRTFSTDRPPMFLHYLSSINSLVYMSSADYNKTMDIYVVDLNTGNSNKHMSYPGAVGMASRSSYVRNNRVVYMTGMAELIEIDLDNKSANVIAKLNGPTNFCVYDSKNDISYYLLQEMNNGFNLHKYDFATKTNSKLKNYPDVNSIIMGTAVYDTKNSLFYLYMNGPKRVAINTNTLNSEIHPVDFALLNTEILNVNVKKQNKEN